MTQVPSTTVALSIEGHQASKLVADFGVTDARWLKPPQLPTSWITSVDMAQGQSTPKIASRPSLRCKKCFPGRGFKYCRRRLSQ